MKKETLLIPRNLEWRKEKIKQMNIKLLSQEVIAGGLDLDESFMDIDPKFVKLKKVNGYVSLDNKSWIEIPIWLKDVEINGHFYCYSNLLTSLEGCPENINGNIYCDTNKIKLELPENVKLKGIFYN